MSEDFKELVSTLKRFRIKETIRDEHELENKLEHYLKEKRFIIQRQKSVTRKIRNDLVCIIGEKKICLELKKFTDISIVQQLDKYIPLYPDGLILICWKCSQSLRDVFRDVKKQITIPLELVELRRYQPIF